VGDVSAGAAGPHESQGGGAAEEEAAAAQRMMDEDIDAILERAEVVDTGHVSYAKATQATASALS
jgi:hypothetical protein